LIYLPAAIFSRPISDRVVFVARPRVRLQETDRRNLLVSAQVLPEVLVIFHADGLVAPARLQVVVKPLRPLELVHHECIGAEIGDVVGDIHVHSVDNRHHHDQRRGGDHNAEQRQKRPQLVAAQRFHRDPERLARRDPHADPAPFPDGARMRTNLGLGCHAYNAILNLLYAFAPRKVQIRSANVILKLV
jgi:hypothetical protein